MKLDVRFNAAGDFLVTGPQVSQIVLTMHHTAEVVDLVSIWHLSSYLLAYKVIFQCVALVIICKVYEMFGSVSLNLHS